MATTTTILSEREYRELVERDDDRLWELWEGVLVEKPPMSMKHDNSSFLLGHLLQTQLDWREFRVNVNGGKTRCTARNFSIPDVVVIPASLQFPYENDPRSFNAFAEPLPSWPRSGPAPRAATTWRRSGRSTGSAGTSRSGSAIRTSAR